MRHLFFFTKKNQSYRDVDFLVLRNFSKEFTAAPMESKDTLQNERDGNFKKTRRADLTFRSKGIS